ncbi:hypothetical protein ANAEL_01422 [Anaerolineales bacterium]|nr:hypothetical protein ANAEL_01422 [Anaerolineales bacterium]
MPEQEKSEKDSVSAEENSIAIGKIEIGGDVSGNIHVGNIYNYATEEDETFSNAEIENGLARFAELLPDRAPILQDRFSALAKKMRATLSSDINSLSPTLKKQYEETLKTIKSMSLEVMDVSFHALCAGKNPPAYDSRSPFRGLESFRPEDSEFFFGREELVKKLIQRIKGHPFLAVLGSPGSGKSSLVMAGVIPTLGSEYVIFRPGAEAIKNLDATLALTKDDMLLVIDQFEELFALNKDADVRNKFISRLLEQVGRLKVIVTMRADFLGEVAPYPQLKDRFETRQIIISPMDAEELRRSIEGQAGVVGLRFESNLVQQILDDVAGEPGAMPLLQHALWILWKRRHGTWLKVDEYSAFGGVKQAIASTAEDIFASCSDVERDQLRDIFLRLTRLDEGNEGRDTRRRVMLQELIPVGSDPAATAGLLDKLINARLVVKNAVSNQSEVEVAHEALIHEWPTLREWINQDRHGLIIHQELSEDTNDWLKLKRDHGALYRGVKLKQALEWAKTNQGLLNVAEQEFLTESQKVSKVESGRESRLVRARKTQWTLIGVSAILGFAAIMVALMAAGVFTPRKMDGIFNIAVADFGESGADGKLTESKTGQLVSQWATTYLQDELKDDPNLLIWPKQANIFSRTHVSMTNESNAETYAADINANVLLFGYIDTGQTPPKLVTKFWIAPQNKYKFEDIQGIYEISEPIRIADMENPGPGIKNELGRQSGAIAWIAMGLSQVQLGNSQDALNAFLEAEKFEPRSEVIQFFIGREYLFMSDEQPPDIQAEYWKKAETAFQNAAEINPQYARAYIGLGGVYLKQSAHLVDKSQSANSEMDPQATQLLDKSIHAYQQAVDLKPDAKQYGTPIEDLARISLANAYKLKGIINALDGDSPAAVKAIEESISILEQTVGIFEESVSQHESYRRYLAQNYEYLGEAYQWLGYAHELVQDYPNALVAYQKSMDSFDLCIRQGDNTADLIITNDIIGLRCEPYLQDVKNSFNNLNGG